MEAEEGQMHPDHSHDHDDKADAAKSQKAKCTCKLPDGITRCSAAVESYIMREGGLFERAIVALILLNTVFLAVEHYGSPQWLEDLSAVANMFFTVIFACEMVVKLFALGCKKYLDDGFNIFDAFIVIMSYVELGLASAGGGANSSLSVLRAFRLLRIFKIVKSWKKLKLLLSTVLDSLTAITNLGVLIILYLFISALLTK